MTRPSEALPPEEALPGVDSLVMEEEIAGLGPHGLLHESGPYAVHLAEAHRIPRTLLELGRLRAQAFPAAFEPGAIDLDPFDRSYSHLFVWNQERAEVVGGYRVGFTDELRASQRPSNLYTSELFAWDPRLLERLDPAMELGRSFVRASYQRSYAALDLLWKGLGALVVRRESMRFLIGALTIPHELPLAARNACLDFMAGRPAPEDWPTLVRGKVPVTDWEPSRHRIGNLSELESRLRSSVGGRIPPLLKHYVRLGARTLAFSCDPSFGGSIDVLIVLDLAALPASSRSRYLASAREPAALA